MTEPYRLHWEAERAEHPYRFRPALRAALQAEYSGSLRQIWVDDGPEWSPDPDIRAHDVVTALLVAGYETFYNRPILPSSVMAQAVEDIVRYGTARSIKDPDDAAEYFFTQPNDPHVHEFRRQLVGIIEDVHSRGLHMDSLMDAIGEELPGMAQTAQRVSNRLGDSASNDQLCTATWQELLRQRLPDRVEIQ